MSDPMDFSQALREIKNGWKVARSGWNGKGMVDQWRANKAARFTIKEGKMGRRT